MNFAEKIEEFVKDEVCAECGWWEQCLTLTLDKFQLQHDSCIERGEPFYVPA